MRPLGPLFACATLLLCAVAPLPGSATASAPPGEVLARAAAAYEAGRCAEVLSLLAPLAARDPSALDGLAEYRRGWCTSRLRRGDPRPFYRRAAEKLSRGAGRPGAALDVHFYLVNALLNLGRKDEAREAARQALELVRQGKIRVPGDDPRAWFRLGKLARDAGRPGDAREPFSRALDLVERGKNLRRAYLERIAGAAAAMGDGDLAGRAARLLGKDDRSPRGLAARARALLAAGRLEEARQAWREAARQPGDRGMEARYALHVLDRVAELDSWGMRPATTTADGREIASLDGAGLRAALAATAREAFRVMERPAVEVPRRRRPGTKPAPSPETREALRRVQARMCGLLLEALRRGVDLRPWAAVRDGYAPLLFHPWEKLYLQRVRRSREPLVIGRTREAGAGAGAPPPASPGGNPGR